MSAACYVLVFVACLFVLRVGLLVWLFVFVCSADVVGLLRVLFCCVVLCLWVLVCFCVFLCCGLFVSLCFLYGYCVCLSALFVCLGL